MVSNTTLTRKWLNSAHFKFKPLNDIPEELKCGPCEKSVLYMSSCDHDNDYIPSSFLLEGGRGQEISSIHISSLSFDDCVVVVLSSLLWKSVSFHPDLEGFLGLPWINPRINPLQANLSDDKLCWDKFCSVQSVYIIIHALALARFCNKFIWQFCMRVGR